MPRRGRIDSRRRGARRRGLFRFDIVPSLITALQTPLRQYLRHRVGYLITKPAGCLVLAAVAAVIEGLRAEGAPVGLLTSVDALMPDQVAGVGK